MHRFRNIFISIATLSILGASIVALPAKAVVPEGDTGNWMVSIDSITPTDSSAQVQGTLYDGITPAGANISITTRHITSDSATNVQYGTQTHGVTNNAGKFTITISTLMSGTSYKITATATAPQGTLATSTQETFTTNQGGDLGSDVQITYDGQPTLAQRTMTLKFKTASLGAQTSATIRLKQGGVIKKTNTIAQIVPDASGVAKFQTTFTGLLPANTYDGQIMLGDGSLFGFGPESTVGTNGVPPTQSPIHVYISENDAVVTSTTFSITGFVTGDSATATSIKGFASADGINYGISSPVAYTGAPDVVGSVFTISFTGLTPSKSYAYKIKDTTNDKDMSPVYYFTTGGSSGTPGSLGSEGPGFVLNANYQSARPQTNTCKEDPKKGEYCMLAPIPFPGIINGKLGLTPDTTGNSGVSNFINGIIQFAIAFAGLLAVIMIIIGGITYATVESMSGKTGAKTMMTNAIFGLLLALCSYLILKTISPSLVDVKLDIAQHNIIVQDEQAGYLAQPNTVTGQDTLGKTYLLKGTYATPTGSTNVKAFVTMTQAQGGVVDIKINTATKTALFTATKYGGPIPITIATVSVPINIGAQGAAEVGKGATGDYKTPKGTWIIPSDRRLSTGTTQSIMNGAGMNMGAAFINTGAKTPDGKDRAIGFHGQANNQLSNTAGCIKMYNDDLLLLFPLMKSGTVVVIN